MDSNGKSTEFDLEERTAKFGEAVIAFAKWIEVKELNLIFSAIHRKLSE
jgi:hypothetical protein